jgi:hypothetical protein
MDAAVLEPKRLSGPVLEKDVGIVPPAPERAPEQLAEEVAIQAGVHARRFVRPWPPSPAVEPASAIGRKVSKRVGLKRAAVRPLDVRLQPPRAPRARIDGSIGLPRSIGNVRAAPPAARAARNVPEDHRLSFAPGR